MKLNRFILSAVLLLAFITINVSGQDHHKWTYNLSIYEVNVRQYTKTGTFNEFATHLDRLQDLGAGILWFMPIHPIGVKNRVETLGSYYAVKDYYDVNPEFGTLNDFKALVDSIHKKGMYVLIDWVGNHTAWDNELTVTHPEWYAKDSAGNFTPPPGTSWSDVIQLDYSKKELRSYMIEAMKFWVNEIHIDGFRCDAVSFMPLDFWKEAIAQLKSLKPDIFMLAEDDGPQYRTAGFDMSYAWRLLAFGTGLLLNVAADSNDANVLYNYSQLEEEKYPGNEYRMYFTTNHDENSWHGTVAEEFGNAAEAFAVFTMTFRSMPLIYSGQEAGLDRRLLFFRKDEIEWKQSHYTELYKNLLHLKKRNKALWNGKSGGKLQRIPSTNDSDIFAYLREKEDDRVFVVLNLSNKEQNFTLQGNIYQGNYRDVLLNDEVFLSADAQFTLSPWGYKVYEIKHDSDD